MQAKFDQLETSMKSKKKAQAILTVNGLGYLFLRRFWSINRSSDLRIVTGSTTWSNDCLVQSLKSVKRKIPLSLSESSYCSLGPMWVYVVNICFFIQRRSRRISLMISLAICTVLVRLSKKLVERQRKDITSTAKQTLRQLVSSWKTLLVCSVVLDRLLVSLIINDICFHNFLMLSFVYFRTFVPLVLP